MFFTSPQDLSSWIISQKNPDNAASKIIEVFGKNNERDIVETCRNIFNKDNNAANVLFGIISEAKMKDKIVKTAQAVMRQDSLYGNMDMRFCPKLPKQSAGQGLISTYNCRHYCLDSFVFDDDPNRIYCKEALWRRHIMDKFSREFKNKDGKWVGGYINQRFQVFHDDGGNDMQLAHGERTRKPRPHQYSTERRLEEGRGEKTTDLTASSNKFVKLAKVEETSNKIYSIFDDMLEMKESGLSDEDIICKVAEHYNMSIPEVAKIHKATNEMTQRHNGTVYSYDNSKVIKTAQFSLPEKTTLVTTKDMSIRVVENGQETTLKTETPVVVISNGQNPTFHITAGPDAGVNFNLKNASDMSDGFEVLDEGQDKIQEAADEVGLNEQTDDFPVVETK